MRGNPVESLRDTRFFALACDAFELAYEPIGFECLCTRFVAVCFGFESLASNTLLGVEIAFALLYADVGFTFKLLNDFIVSGVVRENEDLR